MRPPGPFSEEEATAMVESFEARKEVMDRPNPNAVESRPEWIKCIRVSEPHPEFGFEASLCGQDIMMRWAFEDLEHAEATVRQEGRLVPCPACLAKGKK